MEQINECSYSKEERANIVLLNLEKLKVEITAIEANCDILKDDYTRLCEDAIQKINNLKNELNTEIQRLDEYKTHVNNLELTYKKNSVPVHEKEQGTIVPKMVEEQTKSQSTRKVVDNVGNSIEDWLDWIGDSINKTSDGFTRLLQVLFHSSLH